MDAQRKTDIESKEIELKLLYDEYLQNNMMHLMMQKKNKEEEQFVIAQLATIAQELDQDTQKLMKIKQRERDIINLHSAQEEIDVQMAAVTKYTSKRFTNSCSYKLSYIKIII